MTFEPVLQSTRIIKRPYDDEEPVASAFEPVSYKSQRYGTVVKETAPTERLAMRPERQAMKPRNNTNQEPQKMYKYKRARDSRSESPSEQKMSFIDDKVKPKAIETS